jgi:hypothetical protein
VTEPDVHTTAGTWHDQAPAVPEEARQRLGFAEDDQRVPRLEGLARAAMRAIDGRLELQPVTGRMFYGLSDVLAVTCYASGQAPADVLEAATQLTVELHLRPPFGITNTWSPTGEPLRISRDHLAGVEPLLLPHVEGWGIG